MTALPAILNPEPGDNEDVVSALETADIFWTKGDTDEALRWLKRAAETASDAGNDMRALAIARSVADLKSVPVAAASVAEAPKMSRPPPPSAMARQAPSAPLGDGASRHASSAPQKMPPPLPPSKTRESVAPPAPSARPATSPPPAASPSVPLAPSRSASTDRMTAVNAEARHAAPAEARASAAPPARAVATAPAAEASAVRRSPPASSLPKEPHRALTPGTAYRALTVFVRPQGRNGDKLEVILAKPGQAVPAGAEPALLVPTRRGGRLLG